MKNLNALLAWTQFQYACHHKEYAIATFTSELMEEWMQQIDDIATAKDQSDESINLNPTKTLLDLQSWEEGLPVRSQNMLSLKTGVRLD